MANIKQVLAHYGVSTVGTTGHSFCIGAATAAAQAGLEDTMIQTLGRFHSTAFLRHIRTPVSVLVSATTRLVPQPQGHQHLPPSSQRGQGEAHQQPDP